MLHTLCFIYLYTVCVNGLIFVDVNIMILIVFYLNFLFRLACLLSEEFSGSHFISLTVLLPKWLFLHY